MWPIFDVGAGNRDRFNPKNEESNEINIEPSPEHPAPTH
jgi:hypothetical protein